MAGVIVISSSDLSRIKQTLLPESERVSEGSAQKSAVEIQLKKKDLHAKSLARAKTWDNTLEGSRRKKAEERRQRLDAEEAARQIVDKEEAKIQLEKRKSIIDRANKLLFDDSDRMKSFHSKMMLCDVLAEREAQGELKGELEKLEQVRDERFLELEKQNYRKMLEREMKEKATKEELSKLAARAQKEQLYEYKEKRFREVEDQMLEGELLRRKAIEDLESERKAEHSRRNQAIQALAETQKANEYLKQIKAEDMLRQQREEDKIEEYATRKEKMLQLRKQKEEEVFEGKQKQRMQMIEAQAKKLSEIQNDEDTRIERQVLEKELADERKRVAKASHMDRWENDINQSRAQQIARKKEDRAREKAQEAETAKFLGEWCQVLDAQDREENDMKMAAARKLGGEHKKMVEIQRMRKNAEKSQGDVVATRAKKAIEADTLEFHKYAEDIIREYAGEKKNIIPLVKELRDFRKRVLD